ncbi:TetR/AcrR family transcriptional regulator [Microbacterium rhizomatis]|uniref:TetR/AcrR family transcriptional regulator n=1 Tax=Microbacterium rhizomatis TaxID=1631477 RepID=A0A5J5J653_9MICO|nr:TetR/AcrR family transcriptional regulator [Microbacterium rhizomatis]KAA9110604.1 TetR/AcrR family transcriptional regulator [Microbacterium rhizomatis]
MDRIALTSAAVIAEAALLADRHGFGAVSLSEVARRLGVKTPSLYSHVRDLAALHDGITALALEEMADRVSTAIAGRSQGDALRAYADVLRGYAQESPGRWDSLQRRTGMGAVDSSAARSFVALTDAVLRGYGLSPVARVHATRMLGSTINGFIALERIGSFDHRDPAPETSWAIALDSLHVIFTEWSRAAPPHAEDTPT